MRDDGIDRNEELRNSYRILVGKPHREKSLPIPKHKI
jgi:hypothetical protein